MTLLVTGGGGFVMSVVAGEWLKRDPANKVAILDRSGLDAMAERYFAPMRDRLTVIEGDVCATQGWQDRLDGLGITAIVHGATITPISRGTDPKLHPEAGNPAGIMEVNLMGTVRVADWARSNRAVRRFIYVSSGSVYRNQGPDWAGEPLPEDGYVAPVTLYGISKFASEMVVNRYADLFGLSAASVRLSSIYGPMDRATASRNFRHVPNRIAHMALTGETIRPNSLDAVGDYLSAVDVAHAIHALVDAPALRYRHYNIASGVTTTTGELIAWAAEKVPGLRFEVSTGADANVVHDPRLKDGMWGAYDIARIAHDTGWRPRPGRVGFHDYMDWVAEHDLSDPA
ncbi:NAD-dependent epimerase/dehydratase family protein [Labrys monachus]|uniref:Nucleoside-diphosphate-sugar epimerase n=1 Tax=Labrys monachus TaxID=217067 RepID=A0ABU0F9G7_9HYPH|nr:NAD(P)-dependent oxidoreductase [Labrys monachus]MDQ0391258.1 nucleoside-diphosphate-sugar epimerase [Labrys monachus]